MIRIEDILRIGPVLPIVTLDRAEDAVPLARALIAGGIRVLEVTLRTEAAADAIAAIAAEVPGIVVGAGTMIRPEDVAVARAAGAAFGVSPGFPPALTVTAHASRFPFLPGAMTPSEVMAARSAGHQVLKFFPAEAGGGIAMLRALAAPFPDVMFCPTGGISSENAGAYLALPNVIAVGGSWLAPAAMIRSGAWAEISELARRATTNFDAKP